MAQFKFPMKIQIYTFYIISNNKISLLSSGYCFIIAIRPYTSTLGWEFGIFGRPEQKLIFMFVNFNWTFDLKYCLNLRKPLKQFFGWKMRQNMFGKVLFHLPTHRVSKVERSH